jgi:hypothetical protein
MGLLFHLRLSTHALKNFAGEPRFSLPRIRKSHEPNTTDDLDPSKLNQHVTRLLDLWGPDHSKSTPGRPEWSLRQQFFCDVRGHRRYIRRYGFSCHRLSQLQIIALTMQIYQFTNGQESHLIEAWSILTARQKLERQGVDPGSFALVKIDWGDEIPTD